MESSGAPGGIVEAATAQPAAPERQLPSLRGHYPVKLEASGRVLLPPAFKFAFEGLATLRAHGTSHLNLYNPAAFDAVFEEFKAARPGGVLGPRALKRWNISSFDITVDKQHRFVIPPDLKAKVGLGAEIVLAGAREALEIWSAESFAIEQQELDEGDLFLDDFEGL